MEELWALLLSAQDSPTGIPTELIELKKDEILKRNDTRDRKKSVSPIRRSSSRGRDVVQEKAIKPPEEALKKAIEIKERYQMKNEAKEKSKEENTKPARRSRGRSTENTKDKRSRSRDKRSRSRDRRNRSRDRKARKSPPRRDNSRTRKSSPPRRDRSVSRSRNKRSPIRRDRSTSRNRSRRSPPRRERSRSRKSPPARKDRSQSRSKDKRSPPRKRPSVSRSRDRKQRSLSKEEAKPSLSKLQSKLLDMAKNTKQGSRSKSG